MKKVPYIILLVLLVVVMVLIRYKNLTITPKKQTATQENIDYSPYSLSSTGQFKTKQLSFAKVAKAYENKQNKIAYLLHQSGIVPDKLMVYLQAFKKEGQLKVWAKNRTDKKYQLLTTYKICAKSGKLGPKRKEGDRQVPEGFYRVDQLNPQSSYHLSLHVNYPNPSDLYFADPLAPGGLIFIHGKCATIGCLPIQDDPIEELYLLCAESMNAGETAVPITIFPFEMGDKFNKKIYRKQAKATQLLWDELNLAYIYFEQSGQLPNIKFIANGRAKVN